MSANSLLNRPVCFGMLWLEAAQFHFFFLNKNGLAAAFVYLGKSRYFPNCLNYSTSSSHAIKIASRIFFITGLRIIFKPVKFTDHLDASAENQASMDPDRDTHPLKQ